MEMELTKEFVNSCRKVGVLRDRAGLTSNKP